MTEHIAAVVSPSGKSWCMHFGCNDIVNHPGWYSDKAADHRLDGATRPRTDTVSEVIDERVQVYGDPTVTFQQIADMWSGYLGAPVAATDVPLMLMQMKMVRTKQAPDYSDNSDDIEGYLDIFRQLVPGMIHARSVTEFIEKRKARDA